MRIAPLQTVQDAVSEVRDLQNSLEARGELAGALSLCKALSGFYTTSSEALMGMIEALADERAKRGYTQSEARRAEWLGAEMRRLLNLG